MSLRHRPTIADYMITAISPVLIMGLVGSLVFFLAEVLYAGRYEGRLLWTLFFFVVGIVLVARISIEADLVRSTAYGLALAAVSWLALMAFVEYPKDSPMSPYAGFINLTLITVVWWCAHKLTWDCTFIDEQRDSSSLGLLASAGLEQRPNLEGRVSPDSVKDNGATAAEHLSLVQRWQRFRERRRTRPHSPGLTVVWFSVAALPIFGLGQSLIPHGAAARRSFTFWLAACYIGCALGLLLTTSFLGMRRYLRQRKAPMPKKLAGVWLGLGFGVIVGFLVAASLLPRPYAEAPIVNLNHLGSADRQATKNAPLRDAAGKDDSRSAEENSDRKQDKSDDGRPDPSAREDASDESRSDSTNDRGEQREASDGERRFPDTALGNVLESVLVFLKWTVFILIAFLVLAVLFRGAVKHLAALFPWIERWLAALSAWWMRRRSRNTRERIESIPGVNSPANRPFEFFANPFAAHQEVRRPIEELVAYSFHALEAWAADRGVARQPSETPLEFASRLANAFPEIAEGAQKLAILVARLAYANGKLPPDALIILKRLWETLTPPAAVPA